MSAYSISPARYGRLAETVAAWRLRLAGYRVVGRNVRVAGREVDLTRTERAILAALAGQPGRVLSRAELLAALEADRGKRPGSRAIDVYVTQLRAKLGPGAIRTVHGLGYALCLPPPPRR